MENNELKYIELSDGTDIVKFQILDTFSIDEKNYAALLDEEDQLYILEVEEENNEMVFKSIDDEDEFDDILSLYNELLNDEDEE